jgi:hypothetical protein
MDFHKPASWDEICKRQRARAKYNAWRQSIVKMRRAEVWRLLCSEFPYHKRGSITGIAKRLGVHKTVVSADVRALIQEIRPCPTCHQLPRPAYVEGERKVVIEEPEGGWRTGRKMPRGGSNNGNNGSPANNSTATKVEEGTNNDAKRCE